jgi:hypothetical protein
MNPRTNRRKTACGLTLNVRVVGLDKAVRKKDVQEQVKAE